MQLRKWMPASTQQVDVVREALCQITPRSIESLLDPRENARGGRPAKLERGKTVGLFFCHEVHLGAIISSGAIAWVEYSVGRVSTIVPRREAVTPDRVGREPEHSGRDVFFLRR